MNVTAILIATILGLVATALGIINGLMLLRGYLRDRPHLVIEVIHPDIYQWYFMLPEGTYKGDKTRKYGFLTYIGIINKGLRDVSLNSWTLHLKTKLGKWSQFRPLSIPEPQIELGQTKNLKVWPVLGQKGPLFAGDVMIKSGASIAGFAYYVAEFYSGEGWNPSVKGDKVIGKIVVQDVFGNKSSTKIGFTKIPLDKARKMIPDIDKIDLFGDEWSN